jgi:hypothetical protein
MILQGEKKLKKKSTKVSISTNKTLTYISGHYIFQNIWAFVEENLQLVAHPPTTL